MATAPIITTPFTTYCQKALTPVMFNPFRIVVTMSAPMSVARMLPSPPKVLAPPMSTAPIASSS